jgi:hypothetical protein
VLSDICRGISVFIFYYKEHIPCSQIQKYNTLQLLIQNSNCKVQYIVPGTQLHFCAFSTVCCSFLQEDTYEAGIANDMRELEMRLEYELEEQEKRWSSEEESGKK